MIYVLSVKRSRLNEAVLLNTQNTFKRVDKKINHISTLHHLAYLELLNIEDYMLNGLLVGCVSQLPRACANAGTCPLLHALQQKETKGKPESINKFVIYIYLFHILPTSWQTKEMQRLIALVQRRHVSPMPT